MSTEGEGQKMQYRRCSTEGEVQGGVPLAGPTGAWWHCADPSSDATVRWPPKNKVLNKDLQSNHVLERVLTNGSAMFSAKGLHPEGVPK